MLAKHLAVAGIVLMTLTQPHDEVLSDIPIEYQNYCFELGREYAICPQLLIALIETESSGDPKAKNGSCIGLMQIDENYADSYIPGCDPWEPRTNIEIGILTLIEKGESDIAGGDIGLALALYNGQSNPDCESEFVQKVLTRSHELEVWDNGGL